MTKLTTHVESLALRHTFTIARGSQDVARVVIATLESGGVTGYGEASPIGFYGESPESVEAALAKLDLGRYDLRAYHHTLESLGEEFGEERAALCAVDTAIFDWVAKHHRVPVHRLLGLEASRCPVSSFTVGIDTRERMIAKLHEASRYPIIKIKLGTDDDLGLVRALRAESKATFRVDANCAWTVQETIEKSAELAALGVEFIEQPLPPTELDAMEEVYRKSKLPLVADENCVLPSDVPKLAGRFHGINIKLVKSGGIFPALRMVHLARTFGLRVMYGCMIESSVLITAAAEIGSLADWLDLDGNVLITNDPYIGVRNVDGRLELPALGIARR